MADFKVLNGSDGVWLRSVDIVVIQEGEQALIQQWGLDGNGKHLDIVWKWAVQTRAESSTTATITDRGSNYQNLTVKGLRPGRDFYHAYKPGTTQDYATILEVLVLPAHSQGDHLFLWSESVKKQDAAEFENEASRAGGVQIHIGTSDDLLELLKWYKDTKRTIGRLEFDTHGGPGKLYFRSKAFGASEFGEFKGKGLNAAFAPGARIFFHGCNAAQGDNGLDFLIDVGETLLVGGGGSIGGSSSTGWGTWWIRSPVVHVAGTTTRVYIANDGTIARIERTGEPGSTAAQAGEGFLEGYTKAYRRMPVEAPGHRF